MKIKDYRDLQALYQKIKSYNYFSQANFTHNELVMMFRGIGILNAAGVSTVFKEQAISYFRKSFDSYREHAKFENVEFDSKEDLDPFKKIILNAQKREELYQFTIKGAI